MPPGIALIHLDVDPWEIGKNYPAKVAILGDPKGTLPDLTAAVRERMSSGAQRRGARPAQDRKRRRSPPSARRCTPRRARLPDAVPVQPLALLHAIGETLPKDAVVIEEALSSNRGIRQLIRSDDPQSYFGLRGGGIGWGLPATIGVKLALPDRPVVGLIGDGSAIYTIQALWTAARYRIDAVFVILNNSSYRILKQRLHAMRGLSEQADSYVGMELTDPAIDFVGWRARSALRPNARRPCTRRPIFCGMRSQNGGPTLIDVELDREFKHVMTRRLRPRVLGSSACAGDVPTAHASLA